MKRILAMAGLNLTQILRDRSELVALVGLPLLLTAVFGAAFGAGDTGRAMSVPVADLDGSVYSERVVAAIDEAKGSDALLVSEFSARKLVADGQAPVAVIVPKGFGQRIEDDERTRIFVLRDSGSANAQVIVQIVDGAATRIAANAEASRVAAEALGGTVPFADLFAYADDLWSPDPPVGVESRVVAATTARANELQAPPNTQYSLGFTVFFVMMIALGSAGGILEERELGTLRRLLAAPLRRADILAGKTLGVALVASFEAALLVGFGAFVFGVPWGSNPAAVALLLGSLVAAATGIGIMISAIVRTRDQMSALTPIVSTALAMLGGCYWPLEVTTPFMQRLALLTPTGWAMIGLKDVVARGMGVEAVLVPSAVLLGIAAVTLGIGTTRLRLE
ncbi:MAG: ABC transporter permease [Coriobacteriia bacterium]|nr:ABC transporter permease [Coriobacteriia bacterium]